MAGVLATAAMDVGAQSVSRLLATRPPSPAMLGRWTRHLATGRVRHDDITTASRHQADALIGVTTHYGIGATLGAAYALGGGAERGLGAAVCYGAATTAFAWLILFPSMGFGPLGRKVGEPLAQLSLANHLIFGTALGTALSRLTKRRSLTKTVVPR